MFSDTKAIVIGGLGGIGRCVCLTLLAQKVSKLAIIDLHDGLLDLYGENIKLKNVIYRQCGIHEKVKLREVFTEIWKELNGFNLAINTAGVSNEWDYEMTFKVNTFGLIDFTLLAAEFMRSDQPNGQTQGGTGGSIVNITSTLGYLPYKGFPVYVATKHAALGFLKSIADPKLLEQTNLRLLTICPGYTDTPFVAVRHRHPFSLEEQEEPIPPQDPQTVADNVVLAIQSGKRAGFWRCDKNKIDEIQLLDCKVVG